jgi:hypothetical protein
MSFSEWYCCRCKCSEIIRHVELVLQVTDFFMLFPQSHSTKVRTGQLSTEAVQDRDAPAGT